MSEENQPYHLEHKVFSGGRYLRAFDYASDIDHYEHSILTYMGSLMPFDKGFIDRPAYPSIATIARSTKISESTVRKKIRSLELKGYLQTKMVRFVNSQGKFQQSTNNYSLTNFAFDEYKNTLHRREENCEVRFRSKPSNIPAGSEETKLHSPPVLNKEAPFDARAPRLSQKPPKSYLETTKFNSNLETSSEIEKPTENLQREAERVIEAWESVIKIPVSKKEKVTFLTEFTRVRCNETWLTERLLKIASDPYLLSRAKSINYLFSSLDYAIKDEIEIKKTVTKALASANDVNSLKDLISVIPEFIAKKSRNYTPPSEVIVRHLLQGPINQAKARFSLEIETLLPKNETELVKQLKSKIESESNPVLKARLNDVLLSIPHLNFSRCLDLYTRHCLNFERSN